MLLHQAVLTSSAHLTHWHAPLMEAPGSVQLHALHTDSSAGGLQVDSGSPYLDLGKTRQAYQLAQPEEYASASQL